MPRIQEYDQQVAPASPSGALEPNLEQIGAAGRGIKELGAAVTSGADAVYTRQTQLEQSDVAATVAQKRAEVTQDMQEQVSQGTFDTDKFKQQYQDWANDQADAYETAGGRNAFNRQSNRLLGTVIQKGMQGQTIVAQKNAVASFNSAIDSHNATLSDDPSQFDDIHQSVIEDIDQRVQTGQIPAKDAPALLSHATDQLAKAAVLGTANDDPDAALKLLQDKQFSSNMTPQTQDQLRDKIERLRAYKDNDNERADALKKKADAAVTNKWMTDNIDQIANGSMSPKDVLLNAPIKDFAVQLAFAQKAKEAQNLIQSTSPAKLADVQERMLLDPSDPRAIVDISQLAQEDGLAPKDISKLNTWYLKTPQGAEKKAAEKNMIAEVKGKLQVPGQPDQDFHNRINNANAQYQAEKQKMIDSGGDPSSLLDPSSKDYFPNKIKPVNAIDLMQAQSKRLQDAAAGIKTPAPMNVYPTPGIVPNQNPPKNENEVSRQAPNGRTAVFDKNTKKFLRYQDNG